MGEDTYAGGCFAPLVQAAPLAILISFSFQFMFNLIYEKSLLNLPLYPVVTAFHWRIQNRHGQVTLRLPPRLPARCQQKTSNLVRWTWGCLKNLFLSITQLKISWEGAPAPPMHCFRHQRYRRRNFQPKKFFRTKFEKCFRPKKISTVRKKFRPKSFWPKNILVESCFDRQVLRSNIF